jgi:hypothetical protein
MDQPQTKVTVIQQPGQRPQNRKDLIIDAYISIIKANESGNIEAQIDALHNFIATALPEIPDGAYDQEKVKHLMPDYMEYEKQYFQQHPVILPELRVFQAPSIYRGWRLKYKNILLEEYRQIHRLLKTQTAWHFDKTINIGGGKV